MVTSLMRTFSVQGIKEALSAGWDDITKESVIEGGNEEDEDDKLLRNEFWHTKEEVGEVVSNVPPDLHPDSSLFFDKKVEMKSMQSEGEGSDSIISTVAASVTDKGKKDGKTVDIGDMKGLGKMMIINLPGSLLC